MPIPPPSQNTEYGFARPTDAAAGGGSQRPTDVGPNSQPPTDFGSQRPTEFATLSQRPTDFRGSTFKQNRTICTEVLTKRVRAQAVLTLGKLCLQDEKLAKKCVPVFARQLKTNKDHIIRNNIVVVICDLCIRQDLYTVIQIDIQRNEKFYFIVYIHLDHPVFYFQKNYLQIHSSC